MSVFYYRGEDGSFHPVPALIGPPGKDGVIAQIEDENGTKYASLPTLKFLNCEVTADTEKVTVSPHGGQGGSGGGHVGEIVFFADEGDKENFVKADGSTINPTTWPELAAFAATAGWATDSGTGWYKTPNLQGRFLLPDSAGYAVNTTGGEKEHTLTVDEMPAHAHVYQNPMLAFTSTPPSGRDTVQLTETGSGAGWLGTDMIGKPVTASTGSGQPHNNMPPYYVVSAWIRAKVDTVKASVAEVNSNTLGGFKDGQVLTQQGGKITGQPMALKTYSSIGQLGFTAAQVTTKQVFNAMPEGSIYISNGDFISDKPISYFTLIVTKWNHWNGMAMAYMLEDANICFSMSIDPSSGGLSGNWRRQTNGDYQAGDTITLARCCASGFVSGGGASLDFTIPLDRPVVATKATFSGKINVRGNSGQYAVQNYQFTSTGVLSISNTGITFMGNPTWTNQPTNNTVLSVDIVSGTITLS